MMGRTHVAQGAAVWLGGCVATTLVGWPATPEVVLVGTAAAAGAALLPDADHRSGTLAGVAWPLSKWLCGGVADVSAWVFRSTCTSYDGQDEDGDRRRSGHRTLTHTAVAATLAGVVAGALAALAPYGPAILVGVLVTFAAGAALPTTRVRPVDRWIRRLRWQGSTFWVRVARRVRRVSRRAKRMLLVWPLGAAAAVPMAVYDAGGWWLGVVVAAGWLTHLAGDACTEQGVPLWWPLLIRGQRWRMVGLWRPFRIHTGTRAEQLHLVSAVVLAMAGCWWLLAAG